MTRRKTVCRPSFQARIEYGSYGIPRPSILVRSPHAWTVRTLRAELHGLAMRVELLTPADQYWHVELWDNGADCRAYNEPLEGHVAISVMDGHESEVKVAMAILERVAREAASPPSAQ